MTIEHKMKSQPFHDGLPAKVFTLTNKLGSSITVMDIGATWISCKIKMKDTLREVLLGVDSIEKNITQEAYLGATVGRYANRIKLGKFEIDGEIFQTITNQAGNSLHGGPEGFDKRRWKVLQQEQSKITFSLLSQDGDQGFPGNLTVNVSYHFNDENEVAIEYSATIDKCCPVNLTNHAYFNLMGDEAELDCLAHHLQINADYYLPNDHCGIPLGHLQAVEGNSFDFIKEKKIKDDFLSDLQQRDQLGYDHSFILNDGYQDGKKAALTLTAADRSLQLQVKTTKPALQVYTGNYLQGNPGRGSYIYDNHAGVALETQFLPNSPNNLQWPQPSPFLKPEQTYQSVTRYCFTVL